MLAGDSVSEIQGIPNHPKTIEADSLCAVSCNPASPKRKAVVSAVGIVVDVALLALLVASCASVLSGSFNPFIYFQF